jgi:hypothetical protein
MVAEMLVERHAALAKDEGFMAVRGSVGEKMLGYCFERSWSGAYCVESALGFVGVEGTTVDVRLAIAKLVRRSQNAHVAAPFFEQALASGDTTACSDPDLALSMTAALGLPPRYDNAKMHGPSRSARASRAAPRNRKGADIGRGNRVLPRQRVRRAVGQGRRSMSVRLLVVVVLATGCAQRACPDGSAQSIEVADGNHLTGFQIRRLIGHYTTLDGRSGFILDRFADPPRARLTAIRRSVRSLAAAVFAVRTS